MKKHGTTVAGDSKLSNINELLTNSASILLQQSQGYSKIPIYGNYAGYNIKQWHKANNLVYEVSDRLTGVLTSHLAHNTSFRKRVFPVIDCTADEK